MKRNESTRPAIRPVIRLWMLTALLCLLLGACGSAEPESVPGTQADTEQAGTVPSETTPAEPGGSETGTDASQETSSQTVTPGNTAALPLPEEAKAFFEMLPLIDEGEYTLGTGVWLDRIGPDGSVTASETQALFPVFQNGNLYIAFVLDLGDREEKSLSDSVITDGKALSWLSDRPDDEFRLVSVQYAVAGIDGEETEILYGPEPEAMTGPEEEAWRRLQEAQPAANPLGGEEIMKRVVQAGEGIVPDPDSGNRYSSRTLIVRFTPGDKEEKIRMFEEFCGGKLVYDMKLSDIQVFSFEAKNIKQLRALQKKAMELDYVEYAELDSVNELHMK